jgi:F0F1-type ATP synthase assembly protein I
MQSDQHDAQGRRFAGNILLFQLLATLLASTLLGYADQAVFLSALAGGTIAMVGTAILALGTFRPREGVSSKMVLLSAYSAEVAKVVAVFVLFFLAFRFWPTLDALAMIGIFITNQVVHLIGALNLRHAE